MGGTKKKVGGKKGGGKRKRKSKDDDEPEFICTVEAQPVATEQHVEAQPVATEQHVEEEEHHSEEPQTQQQPEEPVGEFVLSEEHEQPATRKRKRGPTKMKNLAKDPSVRVKVDYNVLGVAVGPGSVKLASYVGTLMREHIPINIPNWKKVSPDLKTLLWRSVQARFELDEDWQRISVIHQMGHLWRSHKSVTVKAINLAANNQERMNLRPPNIGPVDWQKFVKLKTSAAFKAVSEKYKAKRKNQIPHTTSRKGISRLTEEMKAESEDPSSVTRLDVWIKSRTKKDGTPVDTNAADLIQKAAEIGGSDAPAFLTNPDEDHLAKLLGPDNSGRLRAMGRGMSKTKLACLQMQSKCMAEMEERQVKLVKQVNALESELGRIKNQRPEAEMDENSAARSVNKRAHPKCVFVDWSDIDENVGEGRILSSDPDDIVNDCRLGPYDLKVLVEAAYKPDAFLWRPAQKIFHMKEAVGHIIAWPTDKCRLVDNNIQMEDIAPMGIQGNKCKLLDLSKGDVIVAEGRWETQEPSALVNGIPLGPKAVKVFVDSVKQPDTSLWRPTAEMSFLEDCLMAYVSWPLSKVDFENPSTPTGQNATSHASLSASKAKSAATASKSATESKTSATASKAASQAKSASMSSKSASGSESPVDDATGPISPIKNTLPSQSPLRKSPRINKVISKENKKCKLMDLTEKNRVVAEGRWGTNDPEHKVHFTRLGSNAVKVWIDVVKVKNVKVWRPSDEIEIIEDALSSCIAWPENKVIMS